MKHNLTLTTSAAALILTVASAHADSSGFTGFYAPDTWTATGVGFGGASAVFAADGSQLVLTGGDGAGAQTTTVTHAVVGSGIWSFDYEWINFINTAGFDFGYYLHNGIKTDISFGGSTIASGSISIPVLAGDIIGWQVITTDGIFGSGSLTITDFRASVPAPGTLALLGLAALPRPPRRRR